LRADVLIDLLQGLAISGPDGQDAQAEALAAGSGKASVELTVPLTTLLGLNDHPAELAGFGPILADIARRAVEDLRSATWRFTITDKLGDVIWHGAPRRRPSTADIAYIRARDRTCRFPGCRRRATHCQIDHSQGVAEGGL